MASRVTGVGCRPGSRCRLDTLVTWW